MKFYLFCLLTVVLLNSSWCCYALPGGDKFSFAFYGNQIIAAVQEKIPSKDEIISSGNNIISYAKEKIPSKDEIISSGDNIISYAKEKIPSKDEIISSGNNIISYAKEKIPPATQQVKEFVEKNPKIAYIGGGVAVGLVGHAAVAGAIGAAGFQTGGVVAGSWAAKLMSTFGTGGSVIPTLQSVGATGFSALSYITSSLTGAISGCVIEDLTEDKGDEK
ncbi:hypothetical protein Glove_750g40 [Diversispora epigaea]|uniref:Uncharacterized protein n=1 Tax=Diversispora epigaea TaxID=1348612 RepID=A0A397FZK6_9GLOM|nr:hypothetical protein Glove_750g40 [Diversispora epigaea]